MFPREHIEKPMMIRYYRGTVMHKNLYGHEDVAMRYRKDIMSVSIEEFRAYAVHFFHDVKDSNGKSGNA